MHVCMSECAKNVLLTARQNTKLRRVYDTKAPILSNYPANAIKYNKQQLSTIRNLILRLGYSLIVYFSERDFAPWNYLEIITLGHLSF